MEVASAPVAAPAGYPSSGDSACAGKNGKHAEEAYSSAKVLRAVCQLYTASGGDAAERRAADRYLCDFQKSDAVVPVALALLQGHASGQELAPEAALLLATALRRRLQRAPAPTAPAASTPTPAEVLRLACLLRGAPQGGAAVAELLVRAGIALCLHAGALPLDELLSQSASGQGTEAELALVALGALPEEANLKEVKIDRVRPQILLDIATSAPRVLGALGRLETMPAAARLGAATLWLQACDTRAEVLAEFATSPLLLLAGNALAAGGPACAPAAEFLDALLDKSGTPASCPQPLVDTLLQLLASIQPSDVASRTSLCQLVASATTAWRRFFVLAAPTVGAPAPAPAATWVLLLEALRSCSSWGHEAAATVLPAWLSLRDHAATVGALDVYTSVLANAMDSLRGAAVFPANFEALDCDAQDRFLDYRRELRDGLRVMTSSPAELHMYIERLHAAFGQRWGGPWQPLEEALHALSAPAKAVIAQAHENEAVALGALVLLARCAADCGPIVGHRQLLSTFLMCASVYTPVFQIARRSTDAAAQALPARTLELARASLSIEESPARHPESCYPFKVKQDHAGVVCLLRITGGSASSTEVEDQQLPTGDTCALLRGDLHQHLVAAARSQAPSQAAPCFLTSHSLLVLAQAVAHAARRSSSPTAVQDLLTTCLDIVKHCCQGEAPGPLAADALSAAAEVMNICSSQHGEAAAAALSGVWPVLADARLSMPELGRLLCAISDNAAVSALAPLAQLAAAIFQHRPEARPSVFNVAATLGHRIGREPAAASASAAAELVEGLCDLAWVAIDKTGAASARMRYLTDKEVRLPPGCMSDAELAAERKGLSPEAPPLELEVAPEDKALIEAWARAAHELGKKAPALLSGTRGDGRPLGLSLRAAVSLIAAPQRELPLKALSLLTEVGWKDYADGSMMLRMRGALGGMQFEVGGVSWDLGALALRSTMKALMGQMPPNSLGAVVPAARGLFIYDAQVEAWARLALSGDGFPGANTKPETKERAIKELMTTRSDNQKFKAAFKRLCGGKKKGWSQDG